MNLWDRIALLEQALASEMRRREELERRLRNVVREGRVTELDATNNRVRIAFAQDDQGKDVVGPPIPWVERAGAIRTWMPPSVGEQVMMFSPGGEISAASWALPGGYSDQFQKPHDKGAEHKLVIGGTSLLMKDGEVRFVSAKMVFEGDVHLGGEGGKLVHRKSDVDSGGDIAVGSASKVYAL